MSFRLLRVKRRADQDPASSLYFPVNEDFKKVRGCNESETKDEFRLYKIVEKGSGDSPVRIVKPTEREKDAQASPVKVLLLSSFDSSSVAEAIMVQNESIPSLTKTLKSDLADQLTSVTLDDSMAEQFVYDVYRLDLGRYSYKDIEGKANCIEIIKYDQEQLLNEDSSDSETFEDENDSNAEDYYANDYPDEEDSFILDSDAEEGLLFSDFNSITGSLIESNFGQLSFDDSVQVEDGEEFREFSFEDYDQVDSDGDSGSDSEILNPDEFCYDESI